MTVVPAPAVVAAVEAAEPVVLVVGLLTVTAAVVVAVEAVEPVVAVVAVVLVVGEGVVVVLAQSPVVMLPSILSHCHAGLPPSSSAGVAKPAVHPMMAPIIARMTITASAMKMVRVRCAALSRVLSGDRRQIMCRSNRDRKLNWYMKA